ncbi:MAG: insulinase family protein [archaeon]|nr:insulinase family protein [archaeon]MCR4323847.1 insulinase family protein [Nanoarchaeota archaeon]
MKFTKKVLKSGLTLLHEKRDVPVTTVMLGTKYGYGFEEENEKGVAHFLEHLCFKGTGKRTTKQIAAEVEGVGGILNAFTHEEATAYHVTLPSEHFEIAMDVIFDIYFNPIFPEEEVKKEANVICEEIKMYWDNPQRHIFDKIKESLYEKPFGISGAGVAEVVRSMTREQIKKKHDEYYHPKNSVLVVVGNNNFDEVERLANELTVQRDGGIPILPSIRKKTFEGVEKRNNLQQANLALGIHIPTRGKKERYVSEVFSTILGSGMSSRLFTEVREKRGLVYNIKTELDIGKNYAYLIIFAGTEPSKVGDVIKISKEEYAKMSEISSKELEEGKVQILGKRKVENEGSNGTAVNLLLEEIGGNAEDYYKYEEKINSVTLEDIRRMANQKGFSSFVLGP